jgi:hypothetical protein
MIFGNKKASFPKKAEIVERLASVHSGTNNFKFRKKVYFCIGRNGRVVECGGLENRCPVTTGPGVRIPLSPQLLQKQSLFSTGFFVFQTS